MKQQSLKSLVLAITAGSLVACGSADGGSESGAPKLTGQLATDSVESAARSGAMVGAGVQAGNTGNSSMTDAIGSLGDTDGSSSLDQRSLVQPKNQTANVPCELSGQISLTGSESSSSVSMTFVQCMDADQTYMNGGLSMAFSEGANESIAISANYNAFTVTEVSGDSVYLDGDFRFMIEDLLTNAGVSMTSNRFEARTTQSGVTESVVLDDYSMNFSGSQYNFDFYITGDEGTFHIWTEDNLQVNSFGAQSGQLYIEGENAKLSVTLTNTDQTPMAALALDTDKDGTADLTGEMTQVEFFADEDVLSGSL